MSNIALLHQNEAAYWDFLYLEKCTEYKKYWDMIYYKNFFNKTQEIITNIFHENPIFTFFSPVALYGMINGKQSADPWKGFRKTKVQRSSPLRGVKDMENKFTFQELHAIVAALRSEHGCPWDRAQTHATLKENTIEEAYEVNQAVDDLQHTGDPSHLKEELGDLLLQIMLHSQIEENKRTIETLRHQIFALSTVKEDLMADVRRRDDYLAFLGIKHHYIEWMEERAKEKDLEQEPIDFAINESRERE